MVEKFKDKPLPTNDDDALSSHASLINRAIAMHLLREDQFTVASTFLTESDNNSPQGPGNPPASLDLDQRLGLASPSSESLRKQFGSMYHILRELKNERNVLPAIGWARANSEALEARGSNLEFELEKLQFVTLFMGGQSVPDDPLARLLGHRRALTYAREEFARFQTRYVKEIQRLVGAIAFSPNLQQSPYRRIFCNNDSWDTLAKSFTREFCSLLGLSAESPLYIAATAGAIALPTLLKYQTIMKEKRTAWTSENELPVRIWRIGNS